VEVEIQPEPSAEERAAIMAALEEVGGIAATPESPWGLPELDQSHADDPTGA
jgi:hypothetical protein